MQPLLARSNGIVTERIIRFCRNN